MEKIYVFGHKKPDTDSICSAIAYSKFKELMGYTNIKPYRLGKVSRETKFVLNYFKAEEPTYLGELSIQLKDLNLHKPVVISRNEPVRKVWQIIKSVPNNKLIPILDDYNKIEGVITIGDIAKLLLELPELEEENGYEISLKNLIESIDGKIVKNEYGFEIIEGRIIVGSDVRDDLNLTNKDVILTSSARYARKVLEADNCGIVILSAGEKIEGLDKIDSKNTCLMYTDMPTYQAINYTTQSISVKSIMQSDNLEVFKSSDDVEEVVEIVADSAHRNFPVVDQDDNFIGILSRRHLINNKKKNVILVDHNEKGQTVNGIKFAKIMEIIDHHRIADVRTEAPLYMRSEPVGCTCTIIYKMYKENLIPVPKYIAGLMLGAILSDTLLFKSATCTSQDVNAAESLAKIAGVKINEFGQEMFKASTSLEGLTSYEILQTDIKPFAFGKNNVFVSQVNTMNINETSKLKPDFIKDMQELLKINKADLVLLCITDINLGGSELIAVGEDLSVARSAFNIPEDENSVYLNGVTSRKKQIIPMLSQAYHITN